MTIALTQLKAALNSLDPLLAVVKAVSVGDPTFSYTRIGTGVVPPAAAGLVVLIVGRFEEYLKVMTELCLAQYGRATPSIGRSRLSADLQLRIVRDNLTSASKEMVYGVRRNSSRRVQELNIVAQKIVNDEIWGDHAINTAGNPGRETVKNLLQMIGQSDPWSTVEQEFRVRWITRRAVNPSHKSVPNASDELESILVWRNSVAHSSTSIPIGIVELVDLIAFVEELAASIEAVACSVTDAAILAAGGTPTNWP